MWNFLWVSCKPHLSTQAPTSLIQEVWSGSNTFILPCPHPLNGTTTDFLLGGVFARRLQPNHVPCAHWSFKDTPKLRASRLLYYCLPPSQNSAALDGLKADQYSQCRSRHPNGEWKLFWAPGSSKLSSWNLLPLLGRDTALPVRREIGESPLNALLSPETEDLAGKIQSSSLSGFPT